MNQTDDAGQGALSPHAAPWGSHVRWAIEGDLLYVLDLRADAYLSLPLRAWADRQKDLKARGLFETGARAPYREPKPSRDAGVVAMFGALWWARAVLANRQLEAAVARLHERPGANDAKAEALAARFASLRPLYPRDASCLFDSLALGKFLLSAGISATLMFGVRAKPFTAHAWLTKSGRILNDDAEYCSGFTPMAR